MANYPGKRFVKTKILMRIFGGIGLGFCLLYTGFLYSIGKMALKNPQYTRTTVSYRFADCKDFCGAQCSPASLAAIIHNASIPANHKPEDFYISGDLILLCNKHSDGKVYVSMTQEEIEERDVLQERQKNAAKGGFFDIVAYGLALSKNQSFSRWLMKVLPALFPMPQF